MEEITITQNGYDCSYMSYLYAKIKERFSFLPSVCNIKSDGDCAELAFKTEQAYCPYVRRFAEEQIADVISVGYKYAFLDKNIRVPLLTVKEKRLLVTALVSADYKEDKAYAAKRLSTSGSYCLDGAFHFRLKELKRRWIELAEYVPSDMNKAALDGFLEYLTDDGTGKLFVKDGKVYDEEYRLLSRSALTGKSTAVGEILLGGVERVYCFGEADGETAAFLHRYYGNRAIFC